MIAQTGETKAEQAQGAPQTPFAPPPAYGVPEGPQTGFPAPQTGAAYSGSPAGTPGTPVVVVAQQPGFQSYPSEAARAGAQYQTELLAACAAGRHDPKTNYGVCGIITAILCFPIGLIALWCVVLTAAADACSIPFTALTTRIVVRAVASDCEASLVTENVPGFLHIASVRSSKTQPKPISVTPQASKVEALCGPVFRYHMLNF
ncbi:hypothetical protein NMY22_g73 [Coprinellus aureogranulatus]|nr:hypothetical protein NMY22_g73 [Coprinellus aureogranulatus]